MLFRSPAVDANPVGDDLLDTAGNGGAAQSALDEVEDGAADGEEDEALAPDLDGFR